MADKIPPAPSSITSNVKPVPTLLVVSTPIALVYPVPGDERLKLLTRPA